MRQRTSNKEQGTAYLIGYPLVGDKTYGNRQNAHLNEMTGYAVPRQMLHASTLGFVHPMTGKNLELEVQWLDDFRKAESMLT